MSSMNKEQLEALYGPLFPHSDHKVGETIRFYDIVTGAEHEGVIQWVKASGPAVKGGRSFPALYILDSVDPSTGFPWEVSAGDVIA
jgi:hypothetical protein